METKTKRNVFTIEVERARREVKRWSDSKKQDVQLEGRSFERARRPPASSTLQGSKSKRR